MIKDPTLAMQVKTMAEETAYSPEELENTAYILAARLLPAVAEYASRYSISLYDAVGILTTLPGALDYWAWQSDGAPE